MAANLTLGIIKPDAVAGGKTGAILAHLQQAGFAPRAARLVRLTRRRQPQAQFGSCLRNPRAGMRSMRRTVMRMQHGR